MKIITLLFITTFAFGQVKNDTTYYLVNAYQVSVISKAEEKTNLLKQELARTETEIRTMVEMMLGVSLDSVDLFYDPKKYQFKYVPKKKK